MAYDEWPIVSLFPSGFWIVFYANMIGFYGVLWFCFL